MSDLTRPLSRRRLLQVSGMASALVLAQRGAALAEVVAAIPPALRIPDPTMEALCQRARTVDPDVDLEKFKKVTSILWGHFKAGASGAEIPDEDRLLKKAFDHQSGALIVKRLASFSDDGTNQRANGCAFMCGSNAAGLAFEKRSGSIDEDIYVEAWRATERDMGHRLDRARKLARAKGDPVGIGMLGPGC